MAACTALANCPGPGLHLNITAFEGLEAGLEDLNVDLLENVCRGLVCGGRGIGLLVEQQLLCLEPHCQKEEIWPEWARPATCVTIALTALILFSLVYFGKSWSDGRVKVRDQTEGEDVVEEWRQASPTATGPPHPSLLAFCSLLSGTGLRPVFSLDQLLPLREKCPLRSSRCTVRKCDFSEDINQNQLPTPQTRDP